MPVERAMLVSCPRDVLGECLAFLQFRVRFLWNRWGMSSIYLSCLDSYNAMGRSLGRHVGLIAYGFISDFSSDSEISQPLKEIATRKSYFRARKHENDELEISESCSRQLLLDHTSHHLEADLLTSSVSVDAILYGRIRSRPVEQCQSVNQRHTPSVILTSLSITPSTTETLRTMPGLLMKESH